MNDRLNDMTPNGMSLDVIVSPKKRTWGKKDTTYKNVHINFN